MSPTVALGDSNTAATAGKTRNKSKKRNRYSPQCSTGTPQIMKEAKGPEVPTTFSSS